MSAAKMKIKVYVFRAENFRMKYPDIPSNN